MSGEIIIPIWVALAVHAVGIGSAIIVTIASARGHSTTLLYACAGIATFYGVLSLAGAVCDYYRDTDDFGIDVILYVPFALYAFFGGLLSFLLLRKNKRASR